MSFKGDVKQYKKNLERFFHYLYTNPDMNAKCSGVSEQSASLHSKLLNIKDGGNWSLSISPPLSVPIENDEDFQGHKGCILIGGKIIVKESKLSFHSVYVAVVANGKIARRFHFDITSGDVNGARPNCHLQFGGNPRHELELMTDLTYDLDPWLKKPRFPYPPIDLIFLFDLVLRQVETPLGRKFVDERRWKNLVKTSEKTTMKGYFKAIIEYFESDAQDTFVEMLCR